MPERRMLVAVIGSGTESYPELSRALGRWLALKNFDLINGGGPGVMQAVAKAFAAVKDRAGLVLGIIPADGPCRTPEERASHQPPAGYPNPFIDRPIYTHLHLSGAEGKDPASRNHIIILSADLVVALPGGDGTRSEIQLALEYHKPLLLLDPHQQWREFSEADSANASSQTVNASASRLSASALESCPSGPGSA